LEDIKILLVEDDEQASEFICDFLSDAGFDVYPVFTATDGVANLKNNDFKLLLLDINLLDFNGYELLKNIKSYVSIPIVVTSAHSDTKSKLLAFKYGASDYMVKPLDLDELEARIWIQLGKNSEIATNNSKEIFEIKKSMIYFKGEAINLTTIEFEILSLLIKNKNNTISRDELVNALSSISSHRSLDNHIKNIRKKLGDNGSNSIYLKTEYGVGYKLIA
jgi:DNA-binding response OmpR family regulator